MKALTLCIVAICTVCIGVQARFSSPEMAKEGHKRISEWHAQHQWKGFINYAWNTFSGQSGDTPVVIEVLGWNRTNCMGPNGQSRVDVLGGLCTTGTTCDKNPLILYTPYASDSNVTAPAPTYIYATCDSADNGQQRANAVYLYQNIACSIPVIFNADMSRVSAFDSTCVPTSGAHLPNLGSVMLTATSDATRVGVSALYLLVVLGAVLLSRN